MAARCSYVVNGRGLLHIHNERMPTRLQHLNSNVVDKVLDKVEHSLAQGIRATHRPSKVELFCDLLLLPRRAEQLFNVFAEEQVPEKDLVLDQSLARND